MANSLKGPTVEQRLQCHLLRWPLETPEGRDVQKADEAHGRNLTATQRFVQWGFVKHLTEETFTLDEVILIENTHWPALYFCLDLNRHLELGRSQTEHLFKPDAPTVPFISINGNSYFPVAQAQNLGIIL